MSDFAAKLRARTRPEICECAMGAHLVDGSEPDEDCVKAADTITSFTAEVGWHKENSARCQDTRKTVQGAKTLRPLSYGRSLT